MFRDDRLSYLKQVVDMISSRDLDIGPVEPESQKCWVGSVIVAG